MCIHRSQVCMTDCLIHFAYASYIITFISHVLMIYFCIVFMCRYINIWSLLQKSPSKKAPLPPPLFLYALQINQ